MTEKKVREKIFHMLMENARLSFRKIAENLKISTTTVSKIVKELEDEGVIRGYAADVNWHKAGYNAVLCLHISASSNADISKVGTALKKKSAVRQVFYTTGEANFSAYAVCRNTENAAMLISELRRIDGVERVIPHTVLKIF